MPDQKAESEDPRNVKTDLKFPDPDPRSHLLQNNQQLDQNENYNKNKNMKYGDYYENFGESFARRNDIPLGASEDRMVILGELSNRLIAFENKIEKGFESSLFSFNNVKRKHNLWNINDNTNNNSNNNNDNDNHGNNDNNDDNNKITNNGNDDNNDIEEDENKFQFDDNLENKIVNLQNSKDDNEIIKNELYHIKKQLSNKATNKGKRVWNQRIVPPEFYGNFERFDKTEPIRSLGRASSFSDYTGFQSEKSNARPR